MTNKYCNLDGTKKIRDEYTKINDGFAEVEADITNLSFTGSDHDALVTAALVDVEGEDFGASGTATFLDGRLEKWEQKTNAHLADNKQQSINMLTEGAKIDGTDTASLIQSIFTTYGEGKKYFFPEGTYIFETLIEPPSNCIIEGIEGKTIFKVKDGSTATTKILSIVLRSNILIRGITFDGNISNVPDFNNVNVAYRADHIIFEHCEFINSRGATIIFSTDINNSGIRFCKFKNCGILNRTTTVTTDRKQAIAWTSGSQSTMYGNFALFNEFEDIGLDCISFSNQSDGLIIGNIIRHNDSGSIYVSTSKNIIVMGNKVKNSNVGVTYGGNGIDVSNSDYVTIQGNVCEYCGSGGIVIADVIGVSVTGNICRNNVQIATAVPKGGITLDNVCTKITISGNICTDDQATKTQEYGIFAVSDVTLTDVYIDKSNVLTGNKTGDISSLLGYDGEVLVTLNTDATYTICNSSVYGILDIVRINDSKVARLYLRLNQSPLEIYDIGSAFEVTDTGTETAVYYDSVTSTIILKNKYASARSYRFRLTKF